MVCGCGWAFGAGSAYGRACEVEACEVEACEVEACGVEEGARLDAGSTPRIPCPVPWPAGWGGISGLVCSGLTGSDLATSTLLVSVFATIALDVSGASWRAGGIALVAGVTGCVWPAAEASFICPA